MGIFLKIKNFKSVHIEESCSKNCIFRVFSSNFYKQNLNSVEISYMLFSSEFKNNIVTVGGAVYFFKSMHSVLSKMSFCCLKILLLSH